MLTNNISDTNVITAIANACYFNIGARLARYFGNQTYADLATRTWDLIHDLGYISDKWDVYDGAHLPDCTDLNKAQFSYNAAMLLQGAAFLYNYVSSFASFRFVYKVFVPSQEEFFQTLT